MPQRLFFTNLLVWTHMQCTFTLHIGHHHTHHHAASCRDSRLASPMAAHCRVGLFHFFTVVRCQRRQACSPSLSACQTATARTMPMRACTHSAGTVTNKRSPRLLIRPSRVSVLWHSSYTHLCEVGRVSNNRTR